MTAKVRTCLWFDGTGEEAARFYVSLIEGSAIESAFRPNPAGLPLVVNFTLAGTPYQALNGGPMFSFTEATSISVTTKDQAETDRLWQALVAEGGAESHCGWLKDRFGLSWQIIPEALPTLLAGPDKAGAGRAMQAMMGMGRIVIADLEAAYRGA